VLSEDLGLQGVQQQDRVQNELFCFDVVLVNFEMQLSQFCASNSLGLRVLALLSHFDGVVDEVDGTLGLQEVKFLVFLGLLVQFSRLIEQEYSLNLLLLLQNVFFSLGGRVSKIYDQGRLSCIARAGHSLLTGRGLVLVQYDISLLDSEIRVLEGGARVNDFLQLQLGLLVSIEVLEGEVNELPGLNKVLGFEVED